jgi:dienelactone hydrolase
LGRFGWEIEQFGIWIETVREVLEDVASRSVIDPMRLGCLGFSLGAYLSLTLGMTGGRVRAVVEWSGTKMVSVHF